MHFITIRYYYITQLIFILNNSLGVSLLVPQNNRNVGYFSLTVMQKYSEYVDENSCSITKWALVLFHYHNKTFPRVWYCKIVLLLDHLRLVGHVLSHFNTHLVVFFFFCLSKWWMFPVQQFFCVQNKLKKVNNVTMGIF